MYLNLFINSEITGIINGTDVTLKVFADYPSKGDVKLEVYPQRDGETFTIAVRKPGYSKTCEVKVNGKVISYETNKGYIYLERAWGESDAIEVAFDVFFRFVRCNPMVADNIGKVSLMKGPWVYCLEEIDNGNHLSSVVIDTEKEIQSYQSNETFNGVMCAKLSGERIVYTSRQISLYSEERPVYKEDTFTAVPYCCWNNRGKGEMLVWMRERRL